MFFVESRMFKVTVRTVLLFARPPDQGCITVGQATWLGVPFEEGRKCGLRNEWWRQGGLRGGAKRREND